MVSEWNQIIGTIRAIGIWDFVDIAIVAVLIYQVIKLIRETRAMQLAKGLLLLLLMYFVAYNLNMKTVRFIMQNLVATGVLALVIIFQPELRRMLEHVAQTRFNKLNIFQSAQEKDSELMGVWDQSIATIASACAELSRTKTGALIVFERQTKLLFAAESELHHQQGDGHPAPRGAWHERKLRRGHRGGFGGNRHYLDCTGRRYRARI